jgi:chromate reductase, NAD(P)H dehydrogenase (quinone)
VAEDIRLLGICGSLRKASFNMAALRAAAELLPSGVSLAFADIADLPMYNQDVFDAGMPEPARRLRTQIAAADSLLIATPEYNFSLPAALKNAIDWASRPPDQAFHDKPVAVFSVSAGPLGGARVQYDVRRILVQLWAHPLPRPEVFIGSAAAKFDAHGRLTDEPSRKFLAELLAGLRDWTLRMRSSR